MKHLFDTWCRPKKSIRGHAGWGVRHIEGEIDLQEAEQIVNHATYDYRRGKVNPEQDPVKLAYLKPDGGRTLLVHCRKIGVQPGSSREGNYFAHIMTDFDEVIANGLDAILCWGSEDFVREDFDKEPPLNGSVDPKNNGIFNEGKTTQDFLREEGNFERALYLLQAWHLSGDNSIVINGRSRDIARYIYILANCLIESDQQKLTFTTYDSFESPPDGVKIHGIDREKGRDIPSDCYRKGHFTLNLDTDKKAELDPNTYGVFCRKSLELSRERGPEKLREVLGFISKWFMTDEKGQKIEFKQWLETDGVAQDVVFKLFHDTDDEHIELSDAEQKRVERADSGFLDELPEGKRNRYISFLGRNPPDVMWMLRPDVAGQLIKHAGQEHHETLLALALDKSTPDIGKLLDPKNVAQMINFCGEKTFRDTFVKSFEENIPPVKWLLHDHNVALLAKHCREEFFGLLQKYYPPNGCHDTLSWMLDNLKNTWLISVIKETEQNRGQADTDSNARVFLKGYFEYLNLRTCIDYPSISEGLKIYIEHLGDPASKPSHQNSLSLYLGVNTWKPKIDEISPSWKLLNDEIEADYQAQEIPQRKASIRWRLLGKILYNLYEQGNYSSEILRSIQEHLVFVYDDKPGFFEEAGLVLSQCHADIFPDKLFDELFEYGYEEGLLEDGTVPKWLDHCMEHGLDDRLFNALSKKALVNRGKLPGVWGDPVGLLQRYVLDDNVFNVNPGKALDQLIKFLVLPEVDAELREELKEEFASKWDMLKEYITRESYPKHIEFAPIYDEYIRGLKPDEFCLSKPPNPPRPRAVAFVLELQTLNGGEIWNAIPEESRVRVEDLMEINRFHEVKNVFLPNHDDRRKKCVKIYYQQRGKPDIKDFQQMLMTKILGSIKDPKDLLEKILKLDWASEEFCNANAKSELILDLIGKLEDSPDKENISPIICGIILGAVCLNEDGTLCSRMGEIKRKSPPVMFKYFIDRKSRSKDSTELWMDGFANKIYMFSEKYYQKIEDDDRDKLESYLCEIDGSITKEQINALFERGEKPDSDDKSLKLWLRLSQKYRLQKTAKK